MPPIQTASFLGKGVWTDEIKMEGWGNADKEFVHRDV